MTQSSPSRSARVRRAREIGAASGLGEQLAPDFVGAQGDGREAVAMRLRAPAAQRGQTHTQADGEEAGQDFVVGFFLLVDHLLHRRAALTAPFLRPGDARKAGLGLFLLEGLGGVQRTGLVLAGTITLCLAGLAPFGGGIEERACLGAEFGFCGGVVEIHRRCSCQAAAASLRVRSSAISRCFHSRALPSVRPSSLARR